MRDGQSYPRERGKRGEYVNFFFSRCTKLPVNQPNPTTLGGDILVLEEALGCIELNETGHIVGALALSLQFVLDNRQVRVSKISHSFFFVLSLSLSM